MTKEDKKLLLKDLCGRLPYGVMILHKDENGREVTTKLAGYNGDWFNYYIDNLCYHLKLHEFKPYLRPMSSMTDVELEQYHMLQSDIWKPCGTMYYDNYRSIDWLNEHHFDYRGLISKGLALETPEGMYKI